MYKRFFKRILDVAIAVTALACLSPILLLTIVLLVFVNKGMPFFFQIRPGKDGRLFKIIKFKSMAERYDPAGVMLPDSERLTPIGSFIRKISLDEVPQLLNVIKGDMSLVGPRPLLPEYLPLYTPEQMRRHVVKPGITGWAQVNGRNTISWNMKFKYDVWYVDNVCLLVDFKIILLSMKKVFFKEGISSGNSVSMEKFTGS